MNFALIFLRVSANFLDSDLLMKTLDKHHNFMQTLSYLEKGDKLTEKQ